MRIIKIFKLKIYIILILLIIHKNIQRIYYIIFYYIIFIYLNTFIVKKLSKKIEENMKHKKKMKTKRIEKDKIDSQSKLKAYEKKKKCIEVFTFQNQKIIDGSSWFLLIYFFKFRILILF